MPRKILIVEDNKIDRMILSRLLSDKYNVTEVQNGQEAFSLLVENPYRYAAVITDVMMPVMDGYELVRQMRQNDLMHQIPVIIATSDTKDTALAQALACGANNFIPKPYNTVLLRAMLENNIRLREAAADANLQRNDRLTGIFNRETFMQESEKMIQEQVEGYYIISCFDIDHFKVVNDQYGVKMGDQVLKYLASVLKKGYDAIGGICCRISDDRFAALYPAHLQAADALDTILVQAGQVPWLSAPLSFSVGRYIITDLALSPAVMYDRAALAVETIKGNYLRKIAYYDEQLREHLLHEQQITSDMERALAAGEFEPWFQPQYNHTTGALIGAEALVRWRKDGQLIPPGKFITVFEKNGFIYQVDQYIWRQVCAHLRRWLDEGRSPLPVSVNISRYDLFQKDFFANICGLVKEYDLPCDLLRLEVTESAFSESPQQIIEIVTQLVDFGFTVEIDDFGSGYSSLNTLKDVPAQILKLDMRFLEAGHSQRGGNIIESIVRMAKWLDMSVIAEGVEEKEQADFLKTIGCHYIQGYYYARPQPVEDYERLSAVSVPEPELDQLKTLQTLDNNEFWNPKSMETLIFNSYVGAACILEYTKGKIEMLRANDHYVEMLGSSVISSSDVLRFNWSSYLDTRNICLFSDAVTESKETDKTVFGEYEFCGLPGCPEKTVLRVGVRVIAAAGERWLIYCLNQNITAQRAAEEKEKQALRSREQATEQLQAILNYVDVGVVASIQRDGVTEFVFANEKYYQLLGYTRQQFAAEITDPNFTFAPEDLQRVKNIFFEHMQSEQPGVIEAIMLRRDGSRRLIRDSFSTCHFVGINEPVQLSIFRDITEERAYENIQKKEVQRRELLMDNFPWGAGAYAFKDGQMSLIYQNKSYWELVGLQDDKFPDKEPMSAIHPDDIPELMQKLAVAIEHQQDVICDIRLRHLKLGYRLVRLVARIVPEETGGFNIIAAFVPREQVEMSYQNLLSQLLSAIMQSANDFTFAKDKDLRYICCSPAFVRLVGLTGESEVVGKTDFELFPKKIAEQFRLHDMALLESGKPMVDFEETVYEQDGTPHYCLSSKYLLCDVAGVGIGIYGFSRDISREHHVLEQLRISEEEKRLVILHSGKTVCRFDIAHKILTMAPHIATAYCLPEQISNVPEGPVQSGLIAPDSVDAYVGFFAAIQSGSPTAAAVFQQQFTGSWRWLAAKSTTAFADDGQPVKAVISFVDITDRLD